MNKTDQDPKSKKEEKGTQKEITLKEGETFIDLSEKLKIKTKDLIKTLTAEGYSVSATDIISQSLADSLSEKIGCKIKLVSIEEKTRDLAYKHKDELIIRPPVVAIMGHVDHGKTTLLDAIRESNLVGKESGGITQHIGAYRAVHKDQVITFIDTPGHEAFTQLRARGANVTDIVVLVIAADDGVMPQTLEAINHAKAANVPILIAINKTDKKDVDIDKTKQQLSKESLLVEDWGGDVVSVEISAKKKTNLNELLEMILLLSEMLEIKANPNVEAQGIVLEARLDSKKGPVATVIIQHGILTQGAAFITGKTYGKVRALFDENGKGLKKAEPSMPVEILGFSDVPFSGEIFQIVPDIDTAKQIHLLRTVQEKHEQDEKKQGHLTLDQLFQQIEKGDVKELPLIIKADVHGSSEVLKELLPGLSSDQVKIKITHAATGNITESDITLASASNAILIGFNVKPTQAILDLAKEEGTEVRTYNVIYKLTDDIKKAIQGLLEPVFVEKYLGRAEVRRIFQIPRAGLIAGCFVTDGQITRNAEIRIIRNKETIHKGRISSLKHLKENVTEIRKDYECGIGVEKFKDIQEGDIIEAFIIEKETQG